MLSGEGLIAVVNPRRRLGRDSKGRFLKRGHKARANPSHRRRRRHHAKRRHHSRARSNFPRRRRRARHNPRFALPSVGGMSSTLGGALVGAGGAVALDLALQFATPYLPAMIAVPGWPRNLARLAFAFGIGALSGLVVKPATRNAITAGAVTVVTYSIVKDLANQYVLPPTMQLGGDDQTYPYSYNPYLTGLGHGGSASTGVTDGLRGYIRGPRSAVRTSSLPRGRVMSAYVDDGMGAGSSSMGADLEI